MADAKKCDRCGKYYEKIDDKNNINMPNYGLYLLCCMHRIADLCPNCCKSFIEWFNEFKQEDESDDFIGVEIEKPEESEESEMPIIRC